MYTVLHITPHLGGGVGSVLLNYLARIDGNSRSVHRVVCLDYANAKALEVARVKGFDLVENMAGNPAGILKAIGEADIVLVHWWNHPLLYDFLIRQSLPPARIIMWSHISGFHPPYVFTEPLLKYPDIFAFTTPLSLEASEAKNAEDSVRHRFRVIWSTSGVDQVRSVQPRPHEGFRVGYIGTVDYCKLHPNFLRMCMQVNVPGIHFVICGGPCEDAIREEASSLGVGERFTFTGQVDRIEDYLCEFDVFGYPLAPTHYGTCDQALSESMAAGILPVVLSNRMEQHMVENGVTGIVAKNEHEYVRAIERLYRSPEFRQSLSRNAKETAKNRFSIEEMIRQWNQVFDETLRCPKKARGWSGKRSGRSTTSAEVFLESLGEHEKVFLQSMDPHDEKERMEARRAITTLAASSYNWRAKTRGTAHHYHEFFPHDASLQLWSDLMGPSILEKGFDGNRTNKDSGRNWATYEGRTNNL